MADISHRTRPPHPGPWTLDLARDRPETWRALEWPITVRNFIPANLKDALTKPTVVRFLRSDLSELWEYNEWHCYRLLGAGSFGTAAVWQQFSNDGKLLDEIVVKEELAVGRTRYETQEKINEIFPTEAATMYDLNTHSTSGNIVHMRGFKAFTRNPGIKRKRNGPVVHNLINRFYLEYAPYGNLHNLAMRYKAFNRYLPELFLWHVFNSLARAALALETVGDDHAMCYVHLDVKPANIFLGYESAKSQNPTATGGLDGEDANYPSVKLGDFGVTENVSKIDNEGIRDCAGVGTPHYIAPEMIPESRDGRAPPQQYGFGWIPQPNEPDDDLTSKADVWAIGKVMYDLFSLSGHERFSTITAESRPQYLRNGRRMIPNFDRAPFASDELYQESPYTKDLSDLIERCMHAEASRRPTPTELYEVTGKFMTDRYSEAESTSAFSVGSRKLYYRGNEINNMPMGARNCAQHISVRDWHTLIAPGNNDPNEPKLDIYPEQIWNMRQNQQEQDFVERVFHEFQSDACGEEFREALLANDERVNIRGTKLNILDKDDHLTYLGWQDGSFFIKEERKLRQKRVTARRAIDDDGNNNRPDEDDSNDDDNDNDGGGDRGGRGRRHQRSKGRPPANGRGKRQGAPRRQIARGEARISDQDVLSLPQAPKFTPYVSIHAHEERFEHTGDGKDLVFVIDVEPDAQLLPENLTRPMIEQAHESLCEETLGSASQLSQASSVFGGVVYRPRPLPGPSNSTRKRRRDDTLGRLASNRQKRQRLSGRPNILGRLHAP